MTRLLTLLLCFALGSPAASSAAEAVRILSPRDQTLVSTDTVTILGTARRGTQVTWSVERKGKREQDAVKADWGDLFEVFLLLDPGLNRVRVGDQDLRLFYNPGNLAPPAEFRPQTTHGRDISRCEDCHEPLTMRLREGGYPGVCLACHVVVSVNPQNTKAAREDSHFRTAIAGCGSCHEAHVSGTPKLLKASTDALCGACHQPQLPAQGAHPAYEEGGCAACHDAHFSGYAKTLLEPLPTLCQRCHSQGTDAGKPHPPLVQKGSCSQCHNPHGAGKALLRTAAKDTCAACHGEVLRHGHKGELTECATCHDPHRTLSTGLLKKKVAERCTECHDGVAEGKTVHPALDDGCQGCHDPHSDQNVARARVSCGRCHDLKQDAELGSLHGNLDLKPESCRACHPPHASPLDRLVKGNLHYPLTQGKCSVCHGGGAERSVAVADVGARCRMCHPFEQQLAAEGVTLHAPVKGGQCTACHDPHMGSDRAFLRGPEAAVCRKCHPVSDATGGRKLHPPAEGCTECHGAHGGKKAKFLKAAPPEQCLECHDDPRKAVTVRHPALDEGCLACHDPHAGFMPGSLKGDKPYSACLECHEVPDLSQGRTLHTAAQRCSGCHAPHGGEKPKYLSVQEAGEVCVKCHDDPRKAGGQVHAALDEGCLSCHDPHSGFSGAALVKPMKDLCLECHDDPTAGKAVPHDGGAKGCAGCHDPHASKQKHLLRAAGETLCRSCHDFREKDPGRELHAAAESCGDCHESSPHGGAKAKFLRATAPDLCLGCHDDPRKAGGQVHAALEEGCLACHEPHAGYAPGVLKGASPKAVCLECHDDPAAGKRLVHKPVAGGCASCHEPHASKNPALLRKPGDGLCLTCHDAKAHRHSLDAERGRRFPGADRFPQEAGRYRCAGCHAPHASNEKKLYRAPEAELCVACHKI